RQLGAVDSERDGSPVVAVRLVIAEVAQGGDVQEAFSQRGGGLAPERLLGADRGEEREPEQDSKGQRCSRAAAPASRRAARRVRARGGNREWRQRWPGQRREGSPALRRWRC